jgi:hypothetical protein
MFGSFSVYAIVGNCRSRSDRFSPVAVRTT